MNRVLKYLLSFFKKDWEFQDYPLETWENSNFIDENLRFGAGFAGWKGFFGHGKTKKEAVSQLKEHFKNRKQNTSIPRPGTHKPVEFASSKIVDQYEEIAVPFFEKILEMNYYECFISDESSILDFPITEEKLKERLHQHYNLDIANTDGTFVDIFKKIEKRQ